MSGTIFDAMVHFEEDSLSIYYFLLIIDYWARQSREWPRNFGTEPSGGIEYAVPGIRKGINYFEKEVLP